MNESKKEGQPAAAAMAAADFDPQTIDRPYIPLPSTLWGSVSFWIWAAYIILILAAVPDYFVQYWFNNSLGFHTIFFTNLKMQLGLFFIFGGAVWFSINYPIRLYSMSPNLKRGAFHMGMYIGMFAGWRAALHYLDFLLAFHGVPFNQQDPIYGHDIGFYVYYLPVIRLALMGLGWMLVLSVASTVIARFDEMRCKGIFKRKDVDFWAKASLYMPPFMNFLLDLEGLLVAAFLFLLRYGLLLADNEPTGVRIGASYVDVVGLISTKNYIYASIVVELFICALLSAWVSRLNKKYEWIIRQPENSKPPENTPTDLRLRKLFKLGLYALAFDFLIFACLVVRDHVFVRPNEPYIQIPFIQHHIDATLRGYHLTDVKPVEWNLPDKPYPPADLLASKTLQNTPYLPSWVSYLEEPPDIQHYERLKLSKSKLVYGPMLAIYNQQQQLRPYYRFVSVDGVRYQVNGEKQMFVSSVRELPSLAFVGPKEWLRYWGSAALLLTHGMGLVMSPVNKIDELGNPTYVSKDVPPSITDPAFETEPRIYFGEGAKDDYVLTNARNLKEFDFATPQYRQEFVYPPDMKDGIRMDSIWKRIMFAFQTKDITAFLFSRYIDESKTRVHIRRTPMLRTASIAPFLFLDSNNVAFISDKHVLWMVNGLTTTDMYPYSFREILGDKADERAVHEFPERTINYAEDAVKVTIDAYTGEINFYKIKDEPIVNSWADVYPDLFKPMSAMPDSVKAQLNYPLQWYHVQFDDIYKRYHQQDPIQFYNVEDIWDDGDETLGSIGVGMTGFGATDQSTFSYEGYNALIDPADFPAGVNIGKPGDLQYCMLMPFTPEGGRNLRSLIVAFQDPENYGKLVSLQIPQGTFVPGPEMIDAYIDNDRPVHHQVTMWIRHQAEVIRGHLVMLPVKGDLMYVESVWVNSTQNQIPQLKILAVRYHGRITSDPTLEGALAKQGWVVSQDVAEQTSAAVQTKPAEDQTQQTKPEKEQEEGPKNLPPQAAGHGPPPHK